MLETGNNPSPYYNLSIRLSADGFSFVLCRTLDFKSLLFKDFKLKESDSYTDTLRTALNKQSVIRKGEPLIVTIIVDSPTTRIPETEANEEQLTDIYSFNLGDCSSLKILTNALKCGVSQIFALDKDIYHYLSERFPNARFYASPTIIMDHFTDDAMKDNGHTLYTYFHGEKMELFAFSTDGLLFANSFELKHVKDALFYVLSVWKQLNMNAIHDTLLVMGLTPQHDHLLEELSHYISHVEFINPALEFNGMPYANIKDMNYEMQVLLSSLL